MITLLEVTLIALLYANIRYMIPQWFFCFFGFHNNDRDGKYIDGNQHDYCYICGKDWLKPVTIHFNLDLHISDFEYKNPNKILSDIQKDRLSLYQKDDCKIAYGVNSLPNPVMTKKYIHKHHFSRKFSDVNCIHCRVTIGKVKLVL